MNISAPIRDKCTNSISENSSNPENLLYISSFPVFVGYDSFTTYGSIVLVVLLVCYTIYWLQIYFFFCALHTNGIKISCVFDKEQKLCCEENHLVFTTFENEVHSHFSYFLILLGAKLIFNSPFSFFINFCT